HFHTDHPVFSCSKIEQKQLNTWVSFQSAEQPLLGQFSVSGNRACKQSGQVIHSNDGWGIWIRHPRPWLSTTGALPSVGSSSLQASNEGTAHL
ncbi:hypothetical protein, partial [Pseudomonas aeruginosa]|uniref:hypothetical protein n=1 Tax=Pseudomonas aeruginosa TaxID=287 RepID=UPI0021C5E171